jgi:hypothetical protein
MTKSTKIILGVAASLAVIGGIVWYKKKNRKIEPEQDMKSTILSKLSDSEKATIAPKLEKMNADELLVVNTVLEMSKKDKEAFKKRLATDKTFAQKYKEIAAKHNIFS